MELSIRNRKCKSEDLKSMELSIANLKCNSGENKETVDSFKSNGTKRSAEHSPGGEVTKRAVFGDITNRATNKHSQQSDEKNIVKNVEIAKKISRSDSEKEKIISENEKNLSKNSLSRGDSEDLYTTAVEEINLDDSGTEVVVNDTLEISIPTGVEDFDKSNLKDPFSESRYAADIFAYYKERETMFPVKKYMSIQTEMTRGMRAILVDWMVEVQEQFELNHETLYLAVKLVDRYLMCHFVPKTELQLVGATATFVASKFDERIPPLIDDFLYICDDSYTRDHLIQTEVKMLKTVDFTLGIPLSYRFLRRYARCSRISMEFLTLARYILETALMDYELIETRDSKLAAAALLLALKMKDQEWTTTLCHYSGYNENELTDLMILLNKDISTPPSRHLQIIRRKYSHKIFYKVAEIPPLNLKTKN